MDTSGERGLSGATEPHPTFSGRPHPARPYPSEAHPCPIEGRPCPIETPSAVRPLTATHRPPAVPDSWFDNHPSRGPTASLSPCSSSRPHGAEGAFRLSCGRGRRPSKFIVPKAVLRRKERRGGRRRRRLTRSTRRLSPRRPRPRPAGPAHFARPRLQLTRTRLGGGRSAGRR